MTYAELREEISAWVLKTKREYFLSLITKANGGVCRAARLADMDRSNVIRDAKNCGAYQAYFPDAHKKAEARRAVARIWGDE
jgi:hypothetical protein